MQFLGCAICRGVVPGEPAVPLEAAGQVHEPRLVRRAGGGHGLVDEHLAIAGEGRHDIPLQRRGDPLAPCIGPGPVLGRVDGQRAGLGGEELVDLVDRHLDEVCDGRQLPGSPLRQPLRRLPEEPRDLGQSRDVGIRLRCIGDDDHPQVRQQGGRCADGKGSDGEPGQVRRGKIVGVLRLRHDDRARDLVLLVEALWVDGHGHGSDLRALGRVPILGPRGQIGEVRVVLAEAEQRCLKRVDRQEVLKQALGDVGDGGIRVGGHP